MERHKFFVEISHTDSDGRQVVASNNQFEVIVECREPLHGRQIVQAQYGRMAEVTWRGRA